VLSVICLLFLTDNLPSDSGLDNAKPASSENFDALAASSSAVVSSGSQEFLPKLDFFVGDVQLPVNMTIFQVVEKYCRSGVPQGDGNPAASSAPGAPPGKFMWSSVYTIKYKLHQVEEPSQSGSKKGLADSRLHTSSDLTSHLDAVSPPLSLSKDQSLLDVLLLLKTLHSINQFWVSLYPQSSHAAAMGLNAIEFVNSKLNAKLTRQLQDPLALCSASLPDWCKELALAAPFLFFFETRYTLLYSGSFGIARALMVGPSFSFFFFFSLKPQLC